MNKPVYFQTFKTRFGPFRLGVTPKGLYSLEFQSGPAVPPAGETIPRSLRSVLSRAVGEIRSYLAGKRVRFSRLPIDWTGYSRFQKKVLRKLGRIPPGRTECYQFLAQQAGKPGATRAVGQILHRNRLPLVLPCHRIVPKNGGWGGFSQGVRWKKRLLKLECGGVDKRNEG